MSKSFIYLALAAGLMVAAACGEGGGLRRPAAAGLATAFDSTGDTVVARVEGEVPARALRTLTEELRIEPTSSDTALFLAVDEFDVDAADRLWVFDRASQRIFLFSPDGKLYRVVGRRGSGPGEFSWNSGMVALSDSGVAVWDSRNGRVSFFTFTGDFRTSWRAPAGFSTSNGLVTDRSGSIYLRRPVTAPREGEIVGRMGLVRLDPDGALSDSMAPPELPVQRQTYVAVMVSRGGQTVGRSATYSTFAPNYHWAWHPGGWFVAAHGGKYEVVLARKGAPPVVIRRTMPPVPVLPDERAEEQEAITWSMRRTNQKWTWQGPPIPETKAPLTQVLVARDGRIWARVAAPSERIPDSELDPPRPTGPPQRHYRAPVVWEVFESNGRFLGRIPFPPRATLMEADGDRVWAIVRNDDDLPAVMRFRIEPPIG
jgi:hypothetical protein